MSVNKIEDTDVTIVETVEETRTDVEKPQRRDCVGFLKKWWWALLIVFCVVFLIVALPLFLVAIPKIIQGKVDDAELSIGSIRVYDTKSDQVSIEINSTIASSDSIHATIDAFDAVMYLEDKVPQTPFATVSMPETSTGSVDVSVSQTFGVGGNQAFSDFNSWVLLNESLRVSVKGETYVHVKGLKSVKVNFQKTVTLKGLNGFKGLEVLSANISLSPDKRGDNFKGVARVPNPSVFDIEIGNTTFKNLFNNVQIGTLYIDNMILHPGNNDLPIRANISQAPVLSAIVEKPYCTTGLLPFQFEGESVVNNGEELTYFEEGLRANTQDVNLDVGSALAVTLGARLPCKNS